LETSVKAIPGKLPGWRFKTWFASLGPGIITAALVFGPSKITIASKMGADYGFSLLWVVVVAIFFMGVFTSMAARVGIASNHSLLSTIRNKWGKATATLMGIGVFIVTASFQAGNSVGIGMALAELTHTSNIIWIIVFNIFAISLLLLGVFYKTLERLMVALVCIMLLGFCSTLFLIRPNIKDVAGGLAPSLPGSSSALVIAFIASTFSIVGAFYQAYLVQERKKINPTVIPSSRKSLAGIAILGIMSSIVLISAGAILFPRAASVRNATDMALALEPLFGKYASVFFLCGLAGASFSALVGNASVGGNLLADALGYGSGLGNKPTKLFIALIMAIGASVALGFGKIPLQMIIAAQSVTVFIVPFLGTALFLIANDGKIMGAYKNTLVIKCIAIPGLLLLFYLALMNFKALFIK